MSIYYYMHACMIPICLGTSYEVHSYLFSFFMRESFSSCIYCTILEPYGPNSMVWVLHSTATMHVYEARFISFSYCINKNNRTIILTIISHTILAFVNHLMTSLKYTGCGEYIYRVYKQHIHCRLYTATWPCDH